ncbi:transposase [Streptomyces aquilus]|uniref:transposase n=1 Tax=Streptomyces aquilus TaxID=2548456 RepID=UPI00244B6988|nr:transposase [Streptomyces aquilus]
MPGLSQPAAHPCDGTAAELDRDRPEPARQSGTGTAVARGKGCTYDTVLVDVEAGRVVDVLPARTTETFAAWLKHYPGAEIICRDRATAYTKPVREAAPDALEVADRRHLLQNLSAAVEKACHQHRDCLRKRAEEETVTEAAEVP